MAALVRAGVSPSVARLGALILTFGPSPRGRSDFVETAVVERREEMTAERHGRRRALSCR